MADAPPSESSTTSLTNNNPNEENISPEEAYQRSWALISEKIIYLLKRGPQAVMTYEPMYSQIYRAVTAGNSEKMYHDLMALVTKHLEEVNEALGDKDEVSLEHFLAVCNAMSDFIDCNKRIDLLFSYFNKYYVYRHQPNDLLTEFGMLFHRIILESRMPALMIVAEEGLEVPCPYSPSIFHRFCGHVWTLCNRHFAVKYPRVFSRYRMKVIPEMKPEERERNLPEIRDFEARLREHLAAQGYRPRVQPMGEEETR